MRGKMLCMCHTLAHHQVEVAKAIPVTMFFRRSVVVDIAAISAAISKKLRSLIFLSCSLFFYKEVF